MHKRQGDYLCKKTPRPCGRGVRPYILRSAAAATAAEQTLVMRTVSAAAEQNDQRDDDDPDGAVVEQITQTIHYIASFL